MADEPEAARRAARGDAARIAELCDLVRQDLSTARGGPEVLASLAGLLEARAIAARLEEPDAGGAVVGEFSGAVAGFGLVDAPAPLDAARIAFVRVLYVEEGMRRVGVGEAMLDELSRLARSWGAAALDVPALPGDSASKSFLEAMGMRARLLVMSRPL